MDVYVVVKEAVYRHEIVGVYATEAEARAGAEAAARTEPDGHHFFPVIRMTLGQRGEHPVCEINRKDIRHIEDGRYVIDSFEISVTERTSGE